MSGAPLLGETIGDNFDRAVARCGDREALVDCPSGRRLTYSQLRAEVDALARGLLATGIGKGDRVGIWAPNCPEWLFTQYATAKIGAILVTINPAYCGGELEYVLGAAGIRLLVAVESFKDADYAAMISRARPRSAALERVVLIGSPEWDALPVRGGAAAALVGARASLSPDDPINIQYTSGTTGFPKGATLSHHNILNNGYFVGELCGYTEADRICLPVPLYHCFGMVMGNLAATSHGACLVYPAPSFEPAA
ncbi:MAG: AMP-binding protein, partial [Pseudonocardiaceae bacterium]